MSLDPVIAFSDRMNAIEQVQRDLSENIQADEANAQLNLQSEEGIKVTGTAIGVRWNLPSTSFIIDHPVYGELDSSTLQLDGGYGVQGQMSVPLTMPIVFSAGTTVTELLYTVSF